MQLDIDAALRTLRDMANGFWALLPNTVLALVVFWLFLLGARAVRNLVRRATEQKRQHRNLGMLFGRLAQAGLTLLGLLVALAIAVPSFRPAQIISFLGITGVAIGFAFKDILQNFLAGILILLTEPFRLGDQIVFKSFEGTVEDIQTRATTIKTYDGRRVVLPNAELFTNAVTVNTAFEARRSEYDVGIGYGDDIDRARGIMLGVLRGTEGVLAEPAPDVIVVELAGSSVSLRARWWSKPQKGEVLGVQDRVLTGIKTTLTAAGIDLPFPTRQILFHDQTEETDGDRSRQREGWPAGPGRDVPEPRARAVADAGNIPGRFAVTAAGDRRDDGAAG